MRRKEPETLLNKSFSAVVELALKLSKCSKATEDIQNIVEGLPPKLVDKFTSSVIPRLKHPSDELLQSCIHPAVKTLDMCRWQADIQEQMCAVLPHLELRKLSLSVPVTNLWLSTNLVSFSYKRFCTDDMIQELAMSCSSLQVLDVYSAMNVTDNCIPFLLQLQQLQHLNVSGTSLSGEACAELLFGLHKLRKWQGNDRLKNVYEGFSESLEEYVSDFVRAPLVVLADYFPNLTRVSVGVSCGPDAILWFGTLKHLQHFSITYKYEYDFGMKYFVDIHGKNLLTFCVKGVILMDIRHVAAMCPKLKTLKLKHCSSFCATMGDERNLPHFQSVETLEVVLYERQKHDFKFPFFDYSNLQRLVTVNVQIDEISLQRAFIEMDWLRELRTLELAGTSNYLSSAMLMQLLEHCPHLESVSLHANSPMHQNVLPIYKKVNPHVKIIVRGCVTV